MLVLKSTEPTTLNENKPSIEAETRTNILAPRPTETETVASRSKSRQNFWLRDAAENVCLEPEAKTTETEGEAEPIFCPLETDADRSCGLQIGVEKTDGNSGAVTDRAETVGSVAAVAAAAAADRLTDSMAVRTLSIASLGARPGGPAARRRRSGGAAAAWGGPLDPTTTSVRPCSARVSLTDGNGHSQLSLSTRSLPEVTTRLRLASIRPTVSTHTHTGQLSLASLRGRLIEYHLRLE